MPPAARIQRSGPGLGTGNTSQIEVGPLCFRPIAEDGGIQPGASQMRRSMVIAVLLVVATASVSSAQQSAAEHPLGHQAGQVILGLDRVESRVSVEQSLAQRELAILEEVQGLGLMLVRVPDGLEAEAVQELSELEGVAFVELNHFGQAGGGPNDTHFPRQWHLQNLGGAGKAGADIEALTAWDIETGSVLVKVAVLDTGIDFNHTEFAGRLQSGYDFVDEDADPTADHNHGILVTGLLAANTNNGFQVAGIDRRCQVVPVKVLNRNALGTIFDLVQGLDYCVQQGVDVVNMSLINYPPDQSLIQALAAAKAAGCILIASSGNGGLSDADQSWPGASPATLSVGATDSNDRRAPFSGTGNALDFVAPGELTVTVDPNSSNDQFDLFSGTSAAAPITAGIVTLLKAQNPQLDADCAFSLLKASVEDEVGRSSEDTPGWDKFHGHGRVNAGQALQVVGLSVSKKEQSPGDTLTFNMCGGASGGLVLLVAVDVSGTPGFWVVDKGTMDNNFQRSVSFTVPAGLSGVQATFQIFGVNKLSNAAASAGEQVRFL